MATSTPDKPAPKTNRIGLSVLDYRGGKTTLCAGCGHNAISERIIDAMYEMGVSPERVIKPSGIGCSSKSPAYFMGRSHSFNAVHGRMPSVATGAVLANRHLIALGVSGDGDTASIGVGQFIHLMRRNLPIIYIIEDNGVYGLTKGQFSATADRVARLGQRRRHGFHAENWRDQRSPSHRHLRHGHHAGRNFRWPVVFR
jgi:2-oxoglutarate ferredoxin oxidoreductase subunit beta